MKTTLSDWVNTKLLLILPDSPMEQPSKGCTEMTPLPNVSDHIGFLTYVPPRPCTTFCSFWSIVLKLLSYPTLSRVISMPSIFFVERNFPKCTVMTHTKKREGVVDSFALKFLTNEDKFWLFSLIPKVKDVSVNSYTHFQLLFARDLNIF